MPSTVYVHSSPKQIVAFFDELCGNPCRLLRGMLDVLRVDSSEPVPPPNVEGRTSPGRDEQIPARFERIPERVLANTKSR